MKRQQSATRVNPPSLPQRRPVVQSPQQEASAAPDDEQHHNKKCNEEKRQFYRATEITGMRRLRTRDFLKYVDDYR